VDAGSECSSETAVTVLPAPGVKRNSLPRLSSILMVVPFRQHEMQHEGLCAERYIAVWLGGLGQGEQVFHDAMIGAGRYSRVSPPTRRVTGETSG
jgi:hypothetical protein